VILRRGRRRIRGLPVVRRLVCRRHARRSALLGGLLVRGVGVASHRCRRRAVRLRHHAAVPFAADTNRDVRVRRLGLGRGSGRARRLLAAGRLAGTLHQRIVRRRRPGCHSREEDGTRDEREETSSHMGCSFVR
jgi:hypothetical protein